MAIRADKPAEGLSELSYRTQLGAQKSEAALQLLDRTKAIKRSVVVFIPLRLMEISAQNVLQSPTLKWSRHHLIVLPKFRVRNGGPLPHFAR